MTTQTFKGLLEKDFDSVSKQIFKLMKNTIDASEALEQEKSFVVAAYLDQGEFTAKIELFDNMDNRRADEIWSELNTENCVTWHIGHCWDNFSDDDYEENYIRAVDDFRRGFSEDLYSMYLEDIE